MVEAGWDGSRRGCSRLWFCCGPGVPRRSILWTLEDVTFLDGGAASGSFIFDADSSIYSSISVSTTAGTTVLRERLTTQNTRSMSAALSFSC